MAFVFKIVFLFLVWLSAVTGLSYKEVNVVVYYMVIPLGFLLLVDRILKRKFLLSGMFALVWVLLLLAMRDFSHFSDTVFDGSVVFLNSFIAVGWDYTAASVIICVMVPLVVFAALGGLAFLRRRSGCRETERT